MKNLNSNYMNEMPEKDMIEVNGGGMAGPSASYYMTHKQMKQLARDIRDACDFGVGMLMGFFGF